MRFSSGQSALSLLRCWNSVNDPTPSSRLKLFPTCGGIIAMHNSVQLKSSQLHPNWICENYYSLFNSTGGIRFSLVRFMQFPSGMRAKVLLVVPMMNGDGPAR